MTTEPEPEVPEPEKKPRKRSTKPTEPLESVYPGQKIRTKTETEALPFESPEELASSLKREEVREAHELFNELVILVALLVVTAFVVLGLFSTLVLSDKPNL